ncbi:MAG: hypothetical protein AAGC68_06220 [Verrucomicrobiota bacterium]
MIESTDIKSPKARSWALGAAGAGGALAAVPASAGLVQITQTDNILSNQGLRPSMDFTMDGVPDATYSFLTSSFYTTSGIDSKPSSYFLAFLFLSTNPAGRARQYFFYSTEQSAYVSYFSATAGNYGYSYGRDEELSPQTVQGLFPIEFTDVRINGGALTEGWLEIEARNESDGNQEVEIIRLIFDDASTTIDPSRIEENHPEFSAGKVIDENLRGALEAKIKRFNRLIRKAKRSGETGRIRVLKRKIRVVRQRLRNLC